jgi:hypothetical protein
MDIEIIKSVVNLIKSDDALALEKLLKKKSELIDYELPGKENWLHMAASYNSPAVITVLTEYFNIESMDDQGRTALSLALIVDKIEPAKILIKLGANVNHGKQNSPLSCAAYSKNGELLKLLIDNGANNERTDELIQFGKGQGYANIAQDLEEFNYSPREFDIFKDKLAEKYGELHDVEQTDKPYKLYSKEKAKSFMVVSENMNANAEILFDINKFGLTDVDAILSGPASWLADWFQLINQVEIDPSQRFLVIERECESKPYQGILLLKDAEISINSSVGHIYRLFPLHQTEIEFEQQNGMVDLIHQFEEVGLSEIIDNDRACIFCDD